MKTPRMKMPHSPGINVPAKVMRRRIYHLRDVCALINETVSQHKDPAAFKSIVDLAIRDCEVEPVSLAQAFEVNTATVSRWRTGKNAPHQRDRPFVVDWLKREISRTADTLAKQLDELESGDDPSHGKGRKAVWERKAALV
jgi:hypothetical protein